MSFHDSECQVPSTWKFSFLNIVENTPYPLVGIGHVPDGFYDEDMLGHIWLNKDYLKHMV